MSMACLFSGGKDSTLALHKAAGMGFMIDLLITMKPENQYSYMFHYPNVMHTALQAESLGIRQVFAETKGEKETELKDLERVLKQNEVKLLVTGATYSSYQADRINRICKELGIESLSPLWHIEPMEELEYLAAKFNAIITSVSAEGFDESFLGKRIDAVMIAKLQELNRKYKVNMLFEGGEAESFVLDAPLFRRKIAVDSAKAEWNGSTGRYMIEKAHLEDKR